MSDTASPEQIKFERILLGLPHSVWAPVATHWQLSSDLRRLNVIVDEIHFFHTLLPELISSSPYIVVIHSGLLDLKDSANCDRATVIKLAILLPQSRFVIWDKALNWESSDSSLPQNLAVWTDIESSEVMLKVAQLAGFDVHSLGHEIRNGRRT